MSEFKATRYPRWVELSPEQRDIAAIVFPVDSEGYYNQFRNTMTVKKQRELHSMPTGAEARLGVYTNCLSQIRY